MSKSRSGKRKPVKKKSEGLILLHMGLLAENEKLKKEVQLLSKLVGAQKTQCADMNVAMVDAFTAAVAAYSATNAGAAKPKPEPKPKSTSGMAEQGSSKWARTKPPRLDNLDEARRMVAMVREKQAKLKKTSRDEAEKRCAERFDKRKSEYRKGGKCRYPVDEMDAYWEILRSEPCVLQCYPDVPELKPGGVATHGEASVTDDDEASVTDDDSNRMQNEQLIVLAATAVASGRMRTADDEDEDEEEATQDFNVNA